MSRLLTLAAAFCAGVAAHRWLVRQVVPVAAVPLVAQPRHEAPGGVAQVLCRCVDCAPPFLQETPLEAQ